MCVVSLTSPVIGPTLPSEAAPAMAKSTSSTSTAIELKIRVPESTYDPYAERAAKFGRSVEDEIAIRLKECRWYTSANPVYVTDDGRQTLSRLAGRTIKDESSLLDWAHGLAQINVAGITITLDEPLLTRLESRTFG